MKKALLIQTLTTFIFIGLMSQEYVPFPTENASWHIALRNGCFSDDTVMVRYHLHGDTTINGVLYNTLFLEEGDTLNPQTTIVGGLREENKKIYYQGKDFLSFYQLDDILLYDFTKQTGDTIVHSEYAPFRTVILDIDSVFVGHKYRKRYKVDNNLFFHNPDYIIEGIGSVKNGLLGHVTAILECNDHYWEHVCYHENEKLLYLNPSYDNCYPDNFYTSMSNIAFKTKFEIYPNPFIDEITIINHSNQSRLCVKGIDVNGRIIFYEPIDRQVNEIDLDSKPGIYNLFIVNSHGDVLYTKRMIKY